MVLLPLKTKKINSIPTNHRVVGFCTIASVVGFCTIARKVGAEGGQCLTLSRTRMAESIPKRVREYQHVFSKTRISMERWKETQKGEASCLFVWDLASNTNSDITQHR